jgi:tRNA threonylcarbamoyladenosine biosynthesis protein TsaB
LAFILNIETSTTNCSVSLSKEGETLFLKEDYSTQYSHAERLHVYIDDVLKKAKIRPQELSAVAISKGPGSYTGLRIGVSAAKGLCYAIDKPLISVSTLEALAYQVKANDGMIIPLLDARRMEVYSAVFDASFNLTREIKAEIIDPSSFEVYLEQGKVQFIGNGVEKTTSVIQHENAIFIDGKLPSANEMSPLSYQNYLNNSYEDLAYFEPYYLKDFIAIKPKP